ncbi:MAG TPA: OmpA family protein [Bryobacteraceae bacterium]|jgi:chemotaxis protein MotB|nr:OmpA family protein [Bryobacteraceae bacterium]
MLPRNRSTSDRWLISYADFITLLFATFVLMYVAAKKNEQHSNPVQQQTFATRQAAAPSPGAGKLKAELSNSLSLEQSKQVVTLSSEPRGLVITLDDRICFAPGQAQIQPAAIDIFERIGHILAHYPNRVLLQGHTDSTPIHNGQFHSNWELSTARSIAVMEVMEERATLKPERFLIAGAADNAPVSNNETEEGRAQNRRVDVIVLDDAANAQAAFVLAKGTL